jgi:ligand-binding sensor domain-containing protein
MDQGLPGVWVTSLAGTPEGIWVGCFSGLALYADGKLKKFTKSDGLPSNKISALKVVREKLVIGTMDAGLSIRFRNVFTNVTMEKGLTDNRIEAIEAADEGVWVGTVNGLNLVEVR